MTRETAQKVANLLYSIANAERVLNFLDSQEPAWFGSRTGNPVGELPAESLTGARIAYRKLKESAESELEKL